MATTWRRGGRAVGWSVGVWVVRDNTFARTRRLYAVVIIRQDDGCLVLLAVTCLVVTVVDLCRLSVCLADFRPAYVSQMYVSSEYCLSASDCYVGLPVWSSD